MFGPALVALGLTARTDGRAGILALLRRVAIASVPARWYVFAVSYFALIKIGVAVAHRVAAGAWPAFTSTPWVVMIVAIVFSTPVQSGEEIGWRGYLLPRLAARLGLPVASLVVGVIWACWHLPFFFIAGTDKTGQPFAPYLLGVIGLSVAMAWLYLADSRQPAADDGDVLGREQHEPGADPCVGVRQSVVARRPPCRMGHGAAPGDGRRGPARRDARPA